MPNYSPFVR